MKSWDSKQLWLKAKYFVDRANASDHASPDFPFSSALALECLARSALTHIHPALNADPREDLNLLYAFGFNLTAQPRSLPAHSVYLRLEKTTKGFGKTQRELCDFVSLQRNQHLHSSDLPYQNLKISKWLPRYYEVLQVLNEAIGKTLDDFLGDEVASSAKKHVAALHSKTRKAVLDKIAAHKKVFVGKPSKERQKLVSESEIATKHLRQGQLSHECPACGGSGVLRGTLIKELDPVYKNDELLVDEVYLAESFNCLACGLILSGLEEISYTSIEPQFTQTASTSLHDLYQPEFEPEYDNM